MKGSMQDFFPIQAATEPRSMQNGTKRWFQKAAILNFPHPFSKFLEPLQ